MTTNQVLDFIEKRLLQLFLLVIYYVIMIQILYNPPPANINCGNAYLGYHLGLLILSFLIMFVLNGRMIWTGGYKLLEHLILLVLIYLPVAIGFYILN